MERWERNGSPTLPREETNFDMKTINDVEIEFFDGNAYVRLKDYEKLLEEYKKLKENVEENDSAL